MPYNTPEARRQHAPFAEGDIALVYDRRGRRYRVTLKAGTSFHTHVGHVPHDDIIGRQQGFHLRTQKGHALLVVRPTFAERVLELPRQSQVIYPKDLGALLMRADLFPGARVVEVGLGSGATSAAILRAIGPEGSLTTYEVREQIIQPSARNVEELVPETENHTIVVADAYANGIPDRDLDRVLVDVPEPWRLVGEAADALLTGGVLLCYLPTVLQAHELSMCLMHDSRWRLVETVELLERPWHFAEQSARPEHRMVGHTGFITTARRCEPPPFDEPSPVKADDTQEVEGDSE